MCLGGAFSGCCGKLAGEVLPLLQCAKQAPGVSAGSGMGCSEDAAWYPAARRVLSTQGHSGHIPPSHWLTPPGRLGMAPVKGHAAWEPLALAASHPAPSSLWQRGRGMPWSWLGLVMLSSGSGIKRVLNILGVGPDSTWLFLCHAFLGRPEHSAPFSKVSCSPSLLGGQTCPRSIWASSYLSLHGCLPLFTHYFPPLCKECRSILIAMHWGEIG